jgi:hypothetical protein
MSVVVVFNPNEKALKKLLGSMMKKSARLRVSRRRSRDCSLLLAVTSSTSNVHLIYLAEVVWVKNGIMETVISRERYLGWKLML